MELTFFVLLALLLECKCEEIEIEKTLLPLIPSITFRPKTFPVQFNAADKWPECKTIINHIDDQYFFQSCLHVQITHALASRFCIETKGKVLVTLAAWDLITCCPNRKNLFKCLYEQGVTTGGSLRHINPGCRPYEAERCSRQNIESKHNNFSPKCLKSNSTIGNCMVACANRLPLKCQTKCVDEKLEPLKFYAVGSNGYFNYGIPTVMGPGTKEWIMQEIMLYGPIIAIMNYTLHGYNGGIIQKVWDTFKSNGTMHAVRIVGWNHDKNGLHYWLVANSYGKEFGENGMFRLESGRNLMNIEKLIFAPRPDLDRLPASVKQHGYRMNLTYSQIKDFSLDHEKMKEFNTFIDWIL